MFRKMMFSALAAVAVMVGLQAQASAAPAALAFAKPEAAKSEIASNLIEVRGKRGGGFHKGGFRGSRFHRRYHRWHGRKWRHHRWHGRHYRGRRWASYRRCLWKQHRGYRIRCYYPY
ncbi:MAG: hypothetical protein KKB37_03585 [Alphaproteobacteria bacterium]|nr:hypothetical protein [Alphaproteobacteria bacterium]